MTTKALIIYFTRTEMTEKVAQAIAGVEGYPLGKIVVTKAYDGRLAYLRILLDTFCGLKPRITYEGPDPADFDLIIAGTPVWASHFAAPLRSFFSAYESRIKRVAFFCTYGGQGAENALERLRQVSRKIPVGTLYVTKAEFESGAYRKKIALFLDQIKRVMQ